VGEAREAGKAEKAGEARAVEKVEKAISASQYIRSQILGEFFRLS
jgi:hypothetical protein